jgi:hypothetical protein
MKRPAVALGVVVLALVAGVGAARADRVAAEAPAPSEPKRAPVAAATAVCPDPVTNDNSATVVAGTSGAGRPALPGPGQATIAELGPDGKVLATVGPAGTTTLVAAAPKAKPAAVRASGSSAPGLAAGQFTRTSGGELRGLAAVQCAAPGTDFWFVGSATPVGQRGRLYLSNPLDAPAVVDVAVYGDKGSVDAPGGRGVTVPAGGQKVLKLDALAPGLPRLGLHVAVRQGQVSAAVRDQKVLGLVPEGNDWVPVADAPARRVVLPGVLGGPGTRRLQILAPGSSDAIVRVRFVAPDGDFTPAGLDAVEVPAGSVSDLDITKFQNGSSMAVVLEADVPITAGVLIRQGGENGKLADYGYTAATPALAGPAAVPYVQTGFARYAELLLTSTGAATKVTITPIGSTAKGQTAPPAQTVVVPERSSLFVPLATGLGVNAHGVVVQPAAGGAPIYAAMFQREVGSRGLMLTVLPLRAVQHDVVVPEVVPDLTAGLP